MNLFKLDMYMSHNNSERERQGGRERDEGFPPSHWHLAPLWWTPSSQREGDDLCKDPRRHGPETIQELLFSITTRGSSPLLGGDTTAQLSLLPQPLPLLPLSWDTSGRCCTRCAPSFYPTKIYIFRTLSHISNRTTWDYIVSNSNNSNI